MIINVFMILRVGVTNYINLYRRINLKLLIHYLEGTILGNESVIYFQIVKIHLSDVFILFAK